MRDKLRKWREDNHRNSEQIVDVGEELISDHSSKLGDDSKCAMTTCVENPPYIHVSSWFLNMIAWYVHWNKEIFNLYFNGYGSVNSTQVSRHR